MYLIEYQNKILDMIIIRFILCLDWKMLYPAGNHLLFHY